MSDDLDLDLSAQAQPGAVVEVAPLVRRIVAPNPSPFTFTGTASYVVGRGQVAIVDPGPQDPAHRASLLRAVAGETVRFVVATHTHMDHTAGAPALAAAVGAPIVGAGPHRTFRPPHEGEAARLDAGVDGTYRPDQEMADGDVVSGPGWSLRAVATPGHTANHLAFALPEAGLLLSGDHVMGWSTTIVAPPDGSMAAYMASLEKLLDRPEELYLPGHGPAVRNARAFVRQIIGHRRMREAAIRSRLEEGARTIPELVAELYRDLDPRLKGAAGLSVFAHLEELVARGEAATEGPPALAATYRRAG